ncbi:MAG: hypothetical protein R3202_03880 [Candidatus Competibacterales bacterium]|nr:hypothetical protein [Candidatus Competibacterales bacterium]
MDTVILLPGIYLPATSLLPLARRLRRAGFHPLRLGYPALRRSPADNATNLARRFATLDAGVIHYVGHSLGGLVLRHLLAGHSQALPPGRCVTLGTPHRGSAVARALQRRRLGWMLGASRCRGLLGGLPDWPPERELGSLAGIRGVGVGRLLAALEPPHDGTVAADETRCPGMSDHAVVACTHTGLLFAPTVARQTVHFLRHGRFLLAPSVE